MLHSCAYPRNADTKDNSASSFPFSDANPCEPFHRIIVVFFEAEKATVFLDIIH